MRARLVFLLPLFGCGAETGATKGATTFVLVPKRAELDRREHRGFHEDAHGRMVDADREPLLDYCRAKCRYAIPPGRSVVGCRNAEATEEVTKVFAIDARALLICEIE